jgi:fibronectin type 3 domain-containing protein
MKDRLKYSALIFFLFVTGSVSGQQDSLRFREAIAVTGRPAADSITLRWAPLKLSVWQKGNLNGYVIERYVIARDGKVLSQPERTVLTTAPLKPLPEDQWEPIVKKDRFAAITAQALFGARFEINLEQSDVFTIVNKIKENEQRFAFALFSADISPLAAKASGLWYTDKKVKKGEKYLYRILINAADSLRGSLFISPDDPYALPKPRNPQAEFKDQIASLRWDKSVSGKYTAHIVERSTDGRNFSPISDAPLVTVSPTELEDTRYEYAMDSLQDLSKTYYYRIKGVTPFGEESPPSDVVNGKGAVSVSDVPYIKEGENVDNKSIRISWDFPEEFNSAIKGFSVERSSKPQGNFAILTLQNPLRPDARSYEDKTAQQVNYYRVTAVGLNGEQYRSPLYLAQLIDSIPPLAPAGLKATVDEFGSITLSWNQNPEKDIYGYRIYKGNHEKEELAQITREPVGMTSYKDKVNLNTLNSSVYYSVMAVDKNQNHSGLSSLLKVALPDKVKPQPPVMLPVQSSEKGVAISWIKSSSLDVTQYDVYRRMADRNEWQRINVTLSGPDSAYLYLDENAPAGKINYYTVTAIDSAGLESDPSGAVSGRKIDNALRTAVKWKEPVIIKERKQVVLQWGYEQGEIESFKIYKAVDDAEPVLYRTVAADKREFTDTLLPEKFYKYTILVVFANGYKSSLSEELSVSY